MAQEPARTLAYLDNVRKYCYDANGSIVMRDATGVSYLQAFDAENRPERVTTLEVAAFADQVDTKETGLLGTAVNRRCWRSPVTGAVVVALPAPRFRVPP